MREDAYMGRTTNKHVRHKNPTVRVRRKYALPEGVKLEDQLPLPGHLPMKGEVIVLYDRPYHVQFVSELEIRLMPVPGRLRAMAEEVKRKMEALAAAQKIDISKLEIDDVDTGEPIPSIEQLEIEDKKEVDHGD
jgi:hypothetical protein